MFKYSSCLSFCMSFDFKIGFKEKPKNLRGFLAEQKFKLDQGLTETAREFEKRRKDKTQPKQTSYYLSDKKINTWIGIWYTDGMFGDENWPDFTSNPVKAQLTISVHTYNRKNLLRQIAVAKALRDNFEAVLYDPQNGIVVAKHNEVDWRKSILDCVSKR